MGEERVEGRVAAGAPLPADADQLHELAGGRARHIDAQAVQIWLTLSQRLLPVPTCSQQSMRMHAALQFQPLSNINEACSGLLWYEKSPKDIRSNKGGLQWLVKP